MPRRPDKPNLNTPAEDLIAQEIALKERGQVFIGCWPPEDHPEWKNRKNYRYFPTDGNSRQSGPHMAGDLDKKGGGCWHMVRNRCACPCHAIEQLEIAGG